jgi:hypothetical protein
MVKTNCLGENSWEKIPLKMINEPPKFPTLVSPKWNHPPQFHEKDRTHEVLERGNLGKWLAIWLEQWMGHLYMQRKQSFRDRL